MKNAELSVHTRNDLRAKTRWSNPRVRWGLGSILIFLIMWEVVGSIGLIDPRYISQPSRVIQGAFEVIATEDLLYNISLSVTEIIIGFLMAVVFGVLFGVLMGRYRIFGGLFDPLAMALFATPLVALVPLFVVWFGVGMGSKIFIVFIGAFFPILVNTMTGIRQVDRILIRVAQSFHASEWQILTKILLPGSMPAMMTGIRLGWGRGVTGMVIGEMYVAIGGLGYLVAKTGRAMQTDQLLFLIGLVVLIGYGATLGFQQLERKLAPWREGQ